MTQIKICGITLADDAARVSDAGADFIGLNFWPKSRRYLAPERAPIVAAAARGAGAALLVGVFVDAGVDEITSVMAMVDLDVIQLHGGELAEDLIAVAAATRRPVWKAIAVGAPCDIERLETWPADAILLDTPSPAKGGTGEIFDWALAKEARQRSPARLLVLAGGLRTDNVAGAISAVQPWAVDVATGVEAAPGIKDASKVTAFIAAVRAAST
ncbi:MAG: Phosphoribosylanthranilate isomerase [Deltaproteobacteria bacterium]|nr:Phosphoribosylanthranilate isomerase [Deltaproteobacteria bacterium]